MDTIDFRADHRLNDTLALQFFVLRNHFLRRGLVLVVAMSVGLVIATLMNGAPLSDALADLRNNIGRYLAIVLAGAVAGTGRLTFAIAIIAAALSVLTVVALRFRPRRTPAWSPTAAA